MIPIVQKLLCLYFRGGGFVTLNQCFVESDNVLANMTS